MFRIFIILMVLCLGNILCVNDFKPCNTTLVRNKCPETTKCSERNTDGKASTDTGDCICKFDFDFNPNYKNDSDYCIPKRNEPNNTNPTAIPGDSITDSNSTSATLAARQKPPSAHHIIGGIFIPIIIVLLAVAVVYGVKRLRVVQRYRNLRLSRRNRPLYEDVMMGNDNDDPPLI